MDSLITRPDSGDLMPASGATHPVIAYLAGLGSKRSRATMKLSLIHISEPTRPY